MVPDHEEEVAVVLEEAGSGNARKDKKEKQKKEKKHKHKHKHKSGHKRCREEEDGAEVENVHAAVKPHSSEPEKRANGTVPHDDADKAGSDCESGEIPAAEEQGEEARESTAAGGTRSENTAAPRGADGEEGPGKGDSSRCISGHLLPAPPMSHISLVIASTSYLMKWLQTFCSMSPCSSW